MTDWRGGKALDITCKDAIIHAICPYLRCLKKCRKCPEWQEKPDHPGYQRACYSLAEAVMNICQTGRPDRRGGDVGG